ncbi:ketopantoate reductase family protein [Paenalcaligenes sp. Me52]|uniref:ketopantoate reductase family protein n=1 Tax=Paenalcaligenes sp. Me52 TaxID=3392038 RepID=UPI003D2AF541
MKIAIIGAGAMGSLFGSLLSKVSQPVLYDLNTQHVGAIKEHGLRVSYPDRTETIAIHAVSDANELEAMDAVILFVKHPYTQGALQDGLKKAITPNTVVVSLQNGLGNTDLMKQVLNPAQIVYGFSTLTSDLVEPGHIHVTCDLSLHTAMWPLNHQPSPALQRLCELMNQAGLNTSISANVEHDIWMKLLVNASLNSLCGILQQTVGQVVNTPESRQLLDRIVFETADVAQAKGLAISREKALQHVLHVAEFTRDHIPSMAIDIRNRKPTEIEAINGAIVRQGQQLNVATPVTEFAANLVRSLQQHYPAPTPTSH